MAAEISRCEITVMNRQDFKPDLVVIGSSHIVSFLDAASEWRKHFRSPKAASDFRYDPEMRGLLDGSSPGGVFKLDLNFPEHKTKRAAVLTLGPYSEIWTNPREGEVVLNVDQLLRLLRVATQKKGVPVLSFIGGNEIAPFFLSGYPLYDFIDDTGAAVYPQNNVVPIDTQYIDKIIAEAFRRYGEIILPLKGLVSNGKLFHVLPPPPREQPEKAVHREVFDSFAEKGGFVEDALRLKWYARYCKWVTHALSEIGCHVIPPPKESVNGDGLLKEEFALGVTHGNKAYGTLVTKQIGGLLDQLEN